MRKILHTIQTAVTGGLLAAALSAASPAHAGCTLPVYNSSAPNAGTGYYDSGGNQLYYVFNNIFFASQYPGTKGTIHICSFDQWYDDIVANNNNGDGAVKGFVSAQRNYNEPLLSSLPVLKVSFAATAWNSGIYEVAFDNFLSNYTYEVMIWTENHNQLPAGSIIQSGITVDGQTWDLWNVGGYFAFAAPAGSNGFPSNRVISSGIYDQMAFFNYLISQGLMPSTVTLSQIQYGVELVDTGNVPKRFSVTNFSIKDH